MLRRMFELFPFTTIVLDGEGGGGGGAGQGQGSGQGAGGQGGAGSGQGDQGGGAGTGQGGQGQGTGQGGSGGSGQHEENVPYDRFSEVNEQRQAAERERDQLRQQITERERQGLPELDRERAAAQDATARAEAAERERDQLRADGQRRERADWVRGAARELEVTRDGQAERVRFHDVEDAVARINVDELRSEAGALREVQALAERAGHLVAPVQAQQEEQRSGGNAGDLLQQVLDRGQRVDANGNRQGQGDEQRTLAADEFNKLTVDQQVALQEADPGLYERSLRAAAAAT